MKILGLVAITACLLWGCSNPPDSNQPATPNVQEVSTKAPPVKDGAPTSAAPTPPDQTSATGGTTGASALVPKGTNAGDKGASSGTSSSSSKGGPTPPPNKTAKPEAKSYSLLGKWDVVNKLQNLTRTYEFRPDGTYILEEVDETPDKKGTDTVVTAGTYKQDGNKISKHVVSKTEDTDDEPLKAAAAADTKNFAKQVNLIPEYSGTIHWTDADDADIVANPGFNPYIEQEIQLKRHKG